MNDTLGRGAWRGGGGAGARAGDGMGMVLGLGLGISGEQRKGTEDGE